jgi:hypothetical protein
VINVLINLTQDIFKLVTHANVIETILKLILSVLKKANKLDGMIQINVE